MTKEPPDMVHLENCVSLPRLPGWLSLLLVCVVSTVAAHAQEQPETADPFETLAPEEAERAIRLLQQAGAAEREGRWAEAIERYDQVHALIPLEEYRFRSAVCLENLGRYTAALAIYQQLSTSARQTVAASARERVAAVEAHLASLPARLRVVTSQLNASVAVGGQVLQCLTPDGVLVELPPGEHVVRVTLDGYHTIDRAVVLDPGEEASITVVLQASSETELVRTPASARLNEVDRNLTGPIVMWSLAVATAGTGVALGLVANDRADAELAYDLRVPGHSRAEADELGEQAERLALGANISFGVAAAFAVAGLVWFFVGEGGDASPEPDEVRLPVSLSTGGLTIAF